MDEEVGKGTVQGHQNDLVVLLDQFLYHANGSLVHEEPLNDVTHVLVEVPEKYAQAVLFELAVHLV